MSLHFKEKATYSRSHVLVSLLTVVIKYPDKNNMKGKELSGSNFQFIGHCYGELRQQGLERASHSPPIAKSRELSTNARMLDSISVCFNYPYIV